jgi:hypothetical protein
MSVTAAAIGGGLEGRPRQSRILRIASGGWIAARILMRAPHRAHAKTGTEKTRLHRATEFLRRKKHGRKSHASPVLSACLRGIVWGSFKLPWSDPNLQSALRPVR